MTFQAFSTFNYIARDLNMTNETSLSDFRRAITLLCNMTWDQVKQLPNLDANDPYTPLICLESQYVLSLLTSGYSFDDDSWKRIFFVGKISAADVGWAMGYMTERTNAMASVEAQQLLSFTAFISLVVLFCLFLLIGCMMTYHALRMNRSAQSYNRLTHHSYGSLTLSL